jgi:hypothetical protein
LSARENASAEEILSSMGLLSLCITQSLSLLPA